MALFLIKHFYFPLFIATCVTARLIPREPLGPNDVNQETVLPGRSGWERNSQGQTDIRYGDDFLPGHMRHLERNQAQYPSNKDYMKLKGPDNNNREVALHNIPPAPPHPQLGYKRVKDEKLPNMFDNPNHGTQTSVEYREKAESDGTGRPSKDHTSGGTRHNSGTDYVSENGLLSASRSAIRNGGGQEVGRLVPNPGWLTPDRNQRLGHEAPGRLESTPKPNDLTGSSGDGKDDDNKKIGKSRTKKSGKTPDKGKAVDSSSQQSYTRQRTAGDKTLRPKESNEPPRMQKPDPQTPAPRKRKDLTTQLKKNNLQDGTPAKTPGRVWTGGGGEPEVPSHFGAPVQGINPESRRPPRPQNLEAYKKQLADKQQKDDSQAKAQTKAEQGASKLNADLGKKHQGDKQYQDNLARFNQDHPVKAPGKSSEAPARLENRPSSNPQRPAQAPAQEHAQEPWSPNRTPAPANRQNQNQNPSTPLAIRPRPGTNPGHAGSSDVAGPSTPPQRSERPPPGPRRSTREGRGTRKFRRRWLEYALENDLLDRRDFYFLS